MLVAEKINSTVDDQESEARVKVRTLRRISELNQVERVWKRWQQHPNCDYDYFCNNLETLSGVEAPHVLVAYSAGSPEAMLIGRMEKGDVEFRVGYKRIVSVPVRRLTLLHGGWVGNKSPEISAEILKALRGTFAATNADVIYFNHLPTNDPLYQEIQQSVRPGAVCFGEQRRHRGMTLAASGSEFKTLLTSKERNNQKRRERRLLQDFKEKVRVQTYQSCFELDAMIKDIDLIARKTYQRALNVGFEDTPNTRQRLRIEAESGWLRAYVLYLDDRPCAFWMGDVYGGTFYSGFTGYDSEYAKYAPGMFLLLSAMELLCVENSDGAIRTANFGLGDAEWKQVIADLEWQEAAVSLYAESAKGKLLANMQRAANCMNSLGRRIIGHGRVLPRVKRIWRTRLSRSA